MSKAASNTGFDSLIDSAAARYGVSGALIRAIIEVESGFNPNAYNGEGLNDPNQGSFGLGQIQHSARFSWPRYFAAPGNWPQDLYKPEVNIDMTARVLRYFLSRGYTVDTIDAYNVGETAYKKGVRNTAYRQKVLEAYRRYSGLA